MPSRLLLIRHGETLWNQEGRIQGHTDVPLSERGREQARRVGAVLRAEKPAAVVSSDLRRALETAELAAPPGLQPIAEPRFREAYFGEWEGLTHPEMAERFPDAYPAWREDPLRCRPPKGETVEELVARCSRAAREILARYADEAVALVLHGGPIRALVVALLELPLEHYSRLRVANCSFTRIHVDRRGPVLVSLNETAHLEYAGLAAEHQGWEER